MYETKGCDGRRERSKVNVKLEEKGLKDLKFVTGIRDGVEEK